MDLVDLMTPQPWTVQLDDSIAVARRMIAEREIRHLPVLDGGEVVGMCTERDLAAAVDRLGTVADAIEPAHLVSTETPLADVLDLMTAHHWDAVVVLHDGEVEGIFTAGDAVRALRDLVERRAAPEPPETSVQ
jgi:acetoin utilization protein AcuB